LKSSEYDPVEISALPTEQRDKTHKSSIDLARPQVMEKTLNKESPTKTISFRLSTSLNCENITMKPVYVSRYDVTTQSRRSKPSRAFVMGTSEVLTMVVSSAERKRPRHNLDRVS